MEKDGNRKKLGKAGEDLAAAYLEKCGFSILKRNYRFGRFGEIDIIALDHEYICFIEVKTRTGTDYGFPGEAVGYRKQAGIRNLAQIYLKACRMEDRFVRFDVAEVITDFKNGQTGKYSINLIKNAF